MVGEDLLADHEVPLLAASSEPIKLSVHGRLVVVAEDTEMCLW